MIIRRNSQVSNLSERVAQLVKRCATIAGVAEGWQIHSALPLHAAPTRGFLKKTGQFLAINYRRDCVNIGILLSLFIYREIADTAGQNVIRGNSKNTVHQVSRTLGRRSGDQRFYDLFLIQILRRNIYFINEGCIAFDFTYLESTYTITYVRFKYVKSKAINGAGMFISTSMAIELI